MGAEFFERKKQLEPDPKVLIWGTKGEKKNEVKGIISPCLPMSLNCREFHWQWTLSEGGNELSAPVDNKDRSSRSEMGEQGEFKKVLLRFSENAAPSILVRVMIFH